MKKIPFYLQSKMVGLQRKKRVEKALKKKREFLEGIEILKERLTKYRDGTVKISPTCNNKRCINRGGCQYFNRNLKFSVEQCRWNRHDINILRNNWFMLPILFRVHAKSPEFRCNHSFISNLYDSYFLPQIENIVQDALNAGEKGVVEIVSSYLF